MALTRANLRTQVKGRISADVATPVVNDLANESIDRWADEHINDVLEMLPNPALRFKDLVVNETALTISSGTASLPSDHKRPVTITVDSTYTDKDGSSVTVQERRCRIFRDPDMFRRYDSVNFALTPDNRHPFVLVTDKCYFKPTTNITDGKITYIKQHPALSGTQGTLLDELGDNLLKLLIVRRYYRSLEEEHLASAVTTEIQEVLGYGAATQ